MHRYGSFDNPRRQGRARTLAQTHAQRQKRDLAETLQHVLMSTFGREMAGDAMVEGRGVDGVKNGGRGGRHVAVENHRDALQPGRENRARDGGDLAAAEAAQNFEGIASDARGGAASAPSTAAILRFTPSSSRPVPRPTQWAASPP